MSHYKPYPAYKDSGVEWIGRVPEGWSLFRLANVGTLMKANGGNKQDDANDGIPCVRYGDLYTTYDLLIRHVGKFISPAAEADYTAIQYGDILFAASGETFEEIGKSAVNLTETHACCGGDVIVLRPQREIDPVYLAYAAGSSSAQAQKSLMGKGFTVIHVYGDQLRNLVIAAPPEQEQELIGVKIESETARIDALIAKKTEFTELLTMKRQALITQAVTKGLNPRAKMKDSGVEWIGEVPEGWAVCKLSFRYSVELGKMLDEKRITGQHPIPYLRNKDVQWGNINITDLPVMDISPNEIKRYTIKNGDLLVCEGGDVGRSAIWQGADNVIGYQKALHRLRSLSPEKDSVEFYVYALRSAKRNGLFEESETKSTISHLPAEKFREYRFAFPPLDEQVEIAAFLKKTLGRIDLITEKTRLSITLLKKRRSALITAAVTGKIDLRESA